MINIGILSNKQSCIETIKIIQDLDGFKISGIQSKVKQDSEVQSSAIEELIDSSEAVYIDGLADPEVETLKSILRKSTHVFLKEPFFSSPSGISKLIDFQQEAGSVIQIFNPCLFFPEIVRMKGNLDLPLLIDMEVVVQELNDLETELLNTLLFLIGSEGSGFRKIEVFGLQGKDQLLINLHLQFISGSIAQLKLFTSKKLSGKCKLGIYQRESAPISLELDIFDKKNLISEQTALAHFALAIEQNKGNLLSLNELAQAVTAVQEIKDKLKFPNVHI